MDEINLGAPKKIFVTNNSESKKPSLSNNLKQETKEQADLTGSLDGLDTINRALVAKTQQQDKCLEYLKQNYKGHFNPDLPEGKQLLNDFKILVENLPSDSDNLPEDFDPYENALSKLELFQTAKDIIAPTNLKEVEKYGGLENWTNIKALQKVEEVSGHVPPIPTPDTDEETPIEPVQSPEPHVMPTMPTAFPEIPTIPTALPEDF